MDRELQVFANVLNVQFFPFSEATPGSLFVARMLTVVTSLRSQNRNVLEFMTETILAARRGTSSPSLLPQSDSLESISVAA